MCCVRLTPLGMESKVVHSNWVTMGYTHLLLTVLTAYAPPCVCPSCVCIMFGHVCCAAACCNNQNQAQLQ